MPADPCSPVLWPQRLARGATASFSLAAGLVVPTIALACGPSSFFFPAPDRARTAPLLGRLLVLELPSGNFSGEEGDRPDNYTPLKKGSFSGKGPR